MLSVRVSGVLICHQPHHRWLSFIFPQSSTTIPALPTTNRRQPHQRTCPRAPPLYWGMWAPSITSRLPQKRGCSLSRPSPFQRDVGMKEREMRGERRGKVVGEEGKTRWWSRGTWSSEGEGNHDGWRTKPGESNPTTNVTPMTTNGGDEGPTRAEPTRARPTQWWPTPSNPE